MKVRLLPVLLLGSLLLAGCERLVPANQKMMKDAIAASDQAVRSEEKTWAMLLRMEEMAQRLESAAAKAESAAKDAELAAQKAVEATAENQQNAAEAASRAAVAARQAEEAVRRIEVQEGESLQKMLEFMRELGYKP